MRGRESAGTDTAGRVTNGHKEVSSMKRLMQVGVLAGVVALAGAGCNTTTQGSKTYTRGEAQRPMQVTYGTVLSVADVRIEAEETGVGAIGGAVVGGIVGSTIGGGRGTKLATTAGAVAGAAAGSAAERMRGTKPALEIEVKLDNGRVVVVVQEKDDQYGKGDRVRVIDSGGGRLRVRH